MGRNQNHANLLNPKNVLFVIGRHRTIHLLITLVKREKTKKFECCLPYKQKRYLIEQFNGHIEDNILDECWIKPRGIIKKASMATAGLISMDANAMKVMIEGEKNLKAMSKYWD
jgi:hypothetical protein